MLFVKRRISMMKILKRIKAAWARYLEEMAEENKKSFGTGKLDCCQLNKEKNKK
jgi:hypothetical protein